MKPNKILKMIIAIAILIVAILALIYVFMMPNNGKKSSSSSTATQYYTVPSELQLDMSSWNYNTEHNVYWKIGVVYCANPQATEYESMGIYIPGDYMIGTQNPDGTYTCTINETAKIGDYTAITAPIVMPINTAGYSAQLSPTSYKYNNASVYLDAGFIYVQSGCRGRNNGTTYSGGAPWGVTDLKAAVRYLRYNDAKMPGNTDRIFTFGHSGGGAQSALMGATGDSELYFDYLNSIGAIMRNDNDIYISDSIAGAMCWCPITSLDYANEAYEWNMGQYSNAGVRETSKWTSALSKDLARAYAEYINSLNLTDENGNLLTLEESENGVYTAGSYYNYILTTIENSLNNYLSDTTFPDSRTGSETVADYINSLNSEEEQWVTYDEGTNTVKISSISAFVNRFKPASKNIGAFDDLNRTQAENYLFGNDKKDALHFDLILAELLNNNASKYAEYEDYNATYAAEYANDITNVDKLGKTTQYRQNMYNPMYYLLNTSEGYDTSTLAKYWRIRTGINQLDTALTVETNLALSLKQNRNVSSVDFATVWNQGHTTAERIGNSTINFINWVNECLKEQ